MTWAKFGVEFGDELAAAGMSDAAFRTHTEAIGWVYRLEAMDLRIPKHLTRRFAGSPDYETGIKELVDARLWRDRGDAWEVVHHGDVIRQSIAAQRRQRDEARERQRALRKRKAEQAAAPRPGADVTGDVRRDVTRDMRRDVTVNADRQPSTKRRRSSGR